MSWTSGASVLLAGLAAAALGAAAPAAAAAFSTAGAAAGCVPKLEGPIAETAASKAYVRSDFLPKGYVAEEYFFACAVAGQPYRTLLRVMRPADRAKASGIVVVEPWHRGDNWTVYGGLGEHLAGQGHSAVVVVIDEAVMRRFIKVKGPDRYAALSLNAGDEAAYEVLAQAGAALKLNPPKGLKARKLVLSGKSSSAAVIRKYLMAQHKAARIDGKPVYDAYFPLQSAIGETHQPVPDIDVPVVEIQGEREFLLHLDRGKDKVTYRRADGPLFRLYEVAGMSHVGTRNLEGRPERRDVSAAAYTDPRTWTCDSKSLSPVPVVEVYHAAFDMLVRWMDGGRAAPHAPLLETKEGGKEIVRDRFGNARGGWPQAYFEVPVATYKATNGAYPQNPDDQRCDWIGAYEPLPQATLRELYPTPAAYRSKFSARVDRLTKEGWYTRKLAAEMKAEAAKGPPR